MFESTTVEIILYYLTQHLVPCMHLSTTVEIILYYLTLMKPMRDRYIYNSRNYSILLNEKNNNECPFIYNSRNYSILLNGYISLFDVPSTTVEIILYYLTRTL